MKRISLALSVLTAVSTLSLGSLASAAPLSAAGAPPRPATADLSPRADQTPFLKYVVSPWGYPAWYWVVPGPNELICTGTGNPFIHNA